MHAIVEEFLVLLAATKQQRSTPKVIARISDVSVMTGGGSLRGVADAFAETPLNGQREQLPGVDILYLKNVLLKFLDSAAAGRTEQVGSSYHARLWALLWWLALSRNLHAEGSGVQAEVRVDLHIRKAASVLKRCYVLCLHSAKVFLA